MLLVIPFPIRIGGKAFLGTPDEAMGTYMIFKDNVSAKPGSDAENCVEFFACAEKSILFHPVKAAQLQE